MSKPTRWLLAEIDRWTEDQIISREQADRIRERYTAPIAGPPWGLLVFASAGALVIGLGIILLLAYNWDQISKSGKLALVFGAVLGAHLGGLWLYRKGGWQRRLGEACSLLGTMLYGAGIWLVAQVYHIDEHYPNGFLLWALGALALAWILESIPHALLATVLLTFWGGAEVFHFHTPNLWALLLIAVGLAPLAWRKKSALLLATVLAAIELLLTANLIDYGGSARAFTSELGLSVLLISAARLTQAKCPSFSAGADVLAFFGFGGFFLCTYILGFHDAADDLLNWARSPDRVPPGSAAAVHCWSLFVLAAFGWGTIAWQSIGRRRFQVAMEEWLVPIALLHAYGLAAAGLGNSANARFIAGSFNLILLGIAVMWMWRGCRESQLRPTVVGSLLLAAVVLARYFDLFQSLATRGFAFIVLGGIFLAEALYYRKNRRGTPAESGGAT